MKNILYRLWGALPIPLKLRRWIVWLGTDKFLVGVIAAVFNEKGEMLFLKHTYRGKTFPWGPPSGWLKPNEDPDKAIVREIYEETGLRARTVRLLLTETSKKDKRVDIVYLCEIAGGTFTPSTEVSEMAFFAQDTLPLLLDSQYDMILKIFRQTNIKTKLKGLEAHDA